MTVSTDRFDHGLAWEAEGLGYTQALRVGNEIYVSGQLAHDEQGQLIGEGDFAAQAKATFANLDKVLDGIGATRNQVAETTVLVVGLRDKISTVFDAHREYFGSHRPASTMSGVVELALPGQLFEVAVKVRLDLPA
jgi:enamine deaminase RidA (YjgF/YER057c/UK114 family)